jgi:tetratricopeptide (TPR) repeat protein
MRLLLPRLRNVAFATLIATLGASALTTGCATTSESTYLTVGNQYARDGLLREASESYKKALAQKPGNVTAHRNLGMVLVKMGDYKAASRHLEKAMKKYERDFDANLYLGEAYRAQDKYADAIFRYKRALQLKGGDLRAMKPLAWSYFKIRYYSEALQVAKEMQKAGKNDDQVAIITARTLLKLNRSREALATIEAAKKTVARSSKPFYASVEGDILLDLGRADEAAKAYREALKDQPLLAGALLGLGKTMLTKGDSKQAISYMERAVRVKPRLTEAHYLLGKAYEPIDKDKSLRYYQYFRKQASADPEFIGRLAEVKKRIGAMSAQNTKAGAARAPAATPTNGANAAPANAVKR